MTATPDVLDLLGADRSGVAITDGLRVVTYAELAPAVRRRAAALAGHGVTPGDRVVVSVVNSVAAVELYL
ncbi:MAG: long-chain fatty acid--CoA ligase, partial [Mycobacterium sp.]|nr:long-chain fatty acid--CoA ligase [Mycobacterium sp.]